MKFTVIPIVIGELGTVPKGQEKSLKELEIRGKDQQEYLEESWRFEETCCHSDFNEKPLIKTTE